MWTRPSLGARWTVLAITIGTVLVISCGGVAERSPSEESAGATSGAGGSVALTPDAKAGTGDRPVPQPGGRAGTSQGGTKSSPDPIVGLGGCVQPRTSAGFGPGPCDEPRKSCHDYTTTSACAAAGCVPTEGAVSALLPGAGGYGAAPNAPDCEIIKDVFISCEDGFGGATAEYGCNASCDSCIQGPWTVGRYGKWTREDCLWQCVDGSIEHIE